MRTIEEHAAAIAELVASALAARPSVLLPIDPASMSTSPARYSDRRLAADVVAPIDLPPFDNSQMDGYAVDSAALSSGPVALRVGRRIPAGHLPEPLAPGTAAPIMTGAPLPPGADAVVQIERADPPRFLAEDESSAVTLPGDVASGLFVRPTGSDVRAGSVLMAAGTMLRPAHFGVLAASGVRSVSVVEQPRVLVVSTGAELADPLAALPPGAIYDANGAALTAALGGAGAVVTLVRVTDDSVQLLELLIAHGVGAVSGGSGPAAFEPAFDLVVTTGGVSAGAYEVVRETFEPRGVRFASVAMQPGGPQGWGVLDLGLPPARGPAASGATGGGVPVVCFPGNPVSTLVSYEAFLREPLLRGQGRTLPDRTRRAPLAEAADSPPGKHQIRRGRLDADGRVHFVGGPSSHLLNSYALSTVLVHLPLGVDRVEAGAEVVVWPLDD